MESEYVKQSEKLIRKARRYRVRSERLSRLFVTDAPYDPDAFRKSVTLFGVWLAVASVAAFLKWPFFHDGFIVFLSVVVLACIPAVTLTVFTTLTGAIACEITDGLGDDLAEYAPWATEADELQQLLDTHAADLPNALVDEARQLLAQVPDAGAYMLWAEDSTDEVRATRTEQIDQTQRVLGLLPKMIETLSDIIERSEAEQFRREQRQAEIARTYRSVASEPSLPALDDPSEVAATFDALSNTYRDAVNRNKR